MANFSMSACLGTLLGLVFTLCIWLIFPEVIFRHIIEFFSVLMVILTPVAIYLWMREDEDDG